MRIEPGALVAGRWELQERLATGGMGEVFRAVDRERDAAVAVKVLRPGTTHGLRRFAGEIESLRSLDHPNVVRLLEAGEHDGVPFLVMELVPGRPLADQLAHGPLSLREARRLGAEIAEALAAAHERGIVNRDVNPGNILFDAGDHAKLADFGIALLDGAARVTDADATVGSAAYLAPEQITEEEIGPPADVYALGLVLLEVTGGRAAFTGTLKEAAIARLTRDPEVPQDLPASWRRLLALMTARDPASRPTAAEVAAMLTSSDWHDGPE